MPVLLLLFVRVAAPSIVVLHPYQLKADVPTSRFEPPRIANLCTPFDASALHAHKHTGRVLAALRSPTTNRTTLFGQFRGKPRRCRWRRLDGASLDSLCVRKHHELAVDCVTPPGAHRGAWHVTVDALPSLAVVAPPAQRAAKKATRRSTVLCTVVKNRNEFLIEWIEHYLLLGVERIWFYRNNGEPLDSVLRRYANESSVDVDVTFWPSFRSQRAAFAHCLARAKAARIEWALFFDVDEFLVLKKRKRLTDALQRVKQFDVVEVSARLFAAAPPRATDEPLVTRGSVRSRAAAPQVSAKKCIVRVRRATMANNVHTFQTSGARVCAPFCSLAAFELFHYRFIDWPTYMRRHLDGVVGDVGLWRWPKVLSVLQPSKAFLRESSDAARFGDTRTELFDAAERLQQRVRQRRGGALAADWRQRRGVDVPAAPLVARALAANRTQLLRAVARGSFLEWRVAHRSEALRVLFTV